MSIFSCPSSYFVSMHRHSQHPLGGLLHFLLTGPCTGILSILLVVSSTSFSHGHTPAFSASSWWSPPLPSHMAMHRHSQHPLGGLLHFLLTWPYHICHFCLRNVVIGSISTSLHMSVTQSLMSKCCTNSQPVEAITRRLINKIIV